MLPELLVLHLAAENAHAHVKGSVRGGLQANGLPLMRGDGEHALPEINQDLVYPGAADRRPYRAANLPHSVELHDSLDLYQERPALQPERDPAC